jgi:hypothetical protein
MVISTVRVLLRTVIDKRHYEAHYEAAVGCGRNDGMSTKASVLEIRT